MEHLGLVGLPDSGHAQLFSALTGIDTPTGFETTKGVAPLPDDRVDRLGEMSKSKKRIYGTFEIDFIPGLAPGGKAGEGLGSRLLGSLRDTDAVLAVVRAGDDADPAEALGALELDLVLADLASVTDEVAAQPGVAQLASALDSAPICAPRPKIRFWCAPSASTCRAW